MLEDEHLGQLAAAADLPLLVAGSGLALGLPALRGLAPDPSAARLPAARGRAAVVSGSCSAATRGQVAGFIARGGRALQVDPMRLATPGDPVGALVAAALALLEGPAWGAW